MMLMNRFYSKVLAAVVCATAMAPSVFAVSYEVPGGITYEIDEAAGTAVFARLAVQGTFNITELEIPDEVEYNNKSYKVVEVGPQACYLNYSLEKVTFGQNITTISKEAFYNCQKIQTVELPAGLKEIGTQAFYGCQSLESVDLPEGLMSIGSLAFYNNKALENIHVPASVTSMGDNPFCGCSGVIAYTVADGNPICTTDGGVLFNKDKTELLSYPVGNTAKTYVVPSSVKKIMPNSMRNNSYMQNIVFPESLEEIGAGAFTSCNLTSVNIPAGVKKIGNLAFTANSYLTEFKVADGNQNYAVFGKHLCTKDGKTLVVGIIDFSITIPASVENVEGYAFYQSNRLRTLDLSNVKHIGPAAFYRCTQLNSVDFGDNVETIGRDAFMSCSSLASVALPSTTREIGDQCFMQCANLTQLKLNEGLDSIGANAFMLCSSLVNVTLPGSLRKFGTGIFSNDGILASVVFGEGMEIVPNGIFNSCKNLSSVQFPSTLKRIDNFAFCYNSALASIELPEGLETIGTAAFQFAGLRAVKLPDSVRELESAAFGYCSSIETFTAGSGLRIVGDYAIGSCSNMTSLTLNEGLEHIGQGGLGYSMLRSVRIPSTVVTIGDGALAGNKSMTIVENLAVTPQVLTADLLEKPERYEEVVLKVPTGSVAAYKAAAIWSKFSRIEATSGIAGVEADGASVVEVYDVNGVRHQHPVRGINICRMSDGSVRKVFVAD